MEFSIESDLFKIQKVKNCDDNIFKVENLGQDMKLYLYLEEIDELIYLLEEVREIFKD